MYALFIGLRVYYWTMDIQWNFFITATQRSDRYTQVHYRIESHICYRVAVIYKF